MMTLHGLVTIYELFAGFNLINKVLLPDSPRDFGAI